MANDNSHLAKLKPLQIAALVVLMAEAREISNPELKQLAGFDLTGKERTGLVDMKLIESRKVAGNALAHQLTDEGWRTCKNLVEAVAQPRGNNLGRALYVLLGDLQHSLARLRMSHADFFTADDEAEAPTHPEPGTDLESRIRAAYDSLATEPGGWVSLAELRPQLGAAKRSDVDEMLRRLARTPGVHLIPVANLKSLNKQDRDAAVRIGDEDTHALSIEDR